LKLFQEQFKQRYEEQLEKMVREGGYVDGLNSQVGAHDPNHPLLTNQLNLSVLNTMM